ncbi:hypothetical protein [Candidatus Pseudoruminococcus sp.]|jgi:hypothetical protein|uniref:hypothetical protein n=1 Tax=Candidatus Pseudoruminococcus sp. TaxID=3101048 RepID=UPI003999EAC1
MEKQFLNVYIAPSAAIKQGRRYVMIVYTVEGNSGDACRQKQYAVGSSVIYRYGIPAY